jgi:hypothetical protein
MVCEPTSGYETEDVIFVLNLFKWIFMAKVPRSFFTHESS